MTTRHIDSLESFDINGATQWVLLRGNLADAAGAADRAAGARLSAHPGRARVRAATCTWRRKPSSPTGTSAAPASRSGPIPSTITLAQSVADVRAMVDALCARLNVDRVDILGFSIGGTFAMMAAAQDPTRIGHLVVVGLDVDWGESERYAYAFARDEAAGAAPGAPSGSSRPSARRRTTPRRSS